MKRDEEVSNGQHGLLIGYKYRRGSLYKRASVQDKSWAR